MSHDKQSYDCHGASGHIIYPAKRKIHPVLDARVMAPFIQAGRVLLWNNSSLTKIKYQSQKYLQPFKFILSDL